MGQTGEAQVGDVTGDGVINILDIVELINQVLGNVTSAEDLPLGDMNQDGFINILDVVSLVNYVLDEG